MAEVEVMARVERRRNWSDAERAALLNELDVPGNSVPMVARRHGIAPSLLYARQLGLYAPVTFGGSPRRCAPLQRLVNIRYRDSCQRSKSTRLNSSHLARSRMPSSA